MPREIKETVLKVLNEQEIDASNKNIMRVVKWNNGRPRLEKRKFYKAEDNWRPARAAGFALDDLQIIKDNMEEIEQLLGQE